MIANPTSVDSRMRHLADHLPPDAMEAAVSAYEREGARLSAAARGVGVVAAALRGERWVPRL